MTQSSPRHLVTVWNPSYASDAMEEHLAVLLGWAQRHRQGDVAEEDCYVWWGKVRSPNRQQPQAHVADIQALDDAIAADEDGETQLYITDYRSLYVGDVQRIVFGALPPDEDGHVPGYYARDDLNCDFWLELHDVRRLVADDMLAVIDELKKLRNVHYNDRPVSLFGGMVDLPLVVTRPDGARFFGEAERDLVTDGRLWAEFDAASGAGTAGMERELRENLLGDRVWMALEPTARSCVATAETLFRAHRQDPAFDFGPVIASLSKALEVQCNALLRRGLAGTRPTERHAKIGDDTIDVTDRVLSLGQLARALGGERELRDALTVRLEHGAWFTGQLAVVLDALAEVRNPGVHSARIDRATASHWRDQLLGVGCAGHLVELARVRPKPR